MTITTISKPEEANAQWLTAVLDEVGALTQGAVTHVEHQALEGNWSSNAFLKLTYSKGAKGACPKNLFIKTSSGFGPSEVRYYLRDYVDVQAAPLPRCFHAAYDDDRQRYHLLLEDVSATHELVLHRTPILPYAEALADGFGVMHARWWGAEQLAQIGETLPDALSIRRFIDTARPGIAHLRQHYSDEVGESQLDTIDKFFDEHPALLVQRLSDERGFCLIHGDANPTNVFVPTSGLGAPIYLIDRQPFPLSLTTFLGVYDITHATTHRWERVHRQQLEVSMLRRYHHRLVACGIDDYSWPQLVDDYILCAGMGIYDAVERSASGPNEEMKWLWLPMLQMSLQALVDLEDRRRFS
jgi:hypothetical protein